MIFSRRCEYEVITIGTEMHFSLSCGNVSTRKINSLKRKGGPYSRYVLVIHTDEDALDRETVGRFLQGSVFHTKYITDALLGLSYHPSVEPNGGCCPVFRLTLQNRAQFEILVDGAPRSYRDTKLTAMGAAHILKMRAPDSEVVVKDLQTGELTVVAARD